MSNLQKYTDEFFIELEMFEDVSRGHNYKAYLHQAVGEFLEDENKRTALAVYTAFFDSYRITLEGASNPFIDLMDVLLRYEERAASLIDKQRDHYIHSVNVFLLGLCIYSRNQEFQNVFDQVVLDKSAYAYSYDTRHEEFFYRWGIAALFHDVGYPIEIIDKQLQEFVDFVTDVDGEPTLNSYLAFDDQGEFNAIVEVSPRDSFTKAYADRYSVGESLDLYNPIDLLSHKLHISLGIELEDVKQSLDGFIDAMAKHGFIDHGFFSAIIVLRWYSYLIQSCHYKPEYFFYPVLDSASAILLHNYYKNVLTKPPFSKDSLQPFEHPIAYLLILCDELQEWNRVAYGSESKKQIRADDVQLIISSDGLEVTYLVTEGILTDEFLEKKTYTLSKLLDLEAIFSGGYSISSKSISKESSSLTGRLSRDELTARLLLRDLEKLAVAIHDAYNRRQLERHPDQPLPYPTYGDLPDSLKYSNLRQARSIADKIAIMGWKLGPKGMEGEMITEIPEDIVEPLALLEHDQWVQERIQDGWKLGEDKDIENKISPYLIPYSELNEEIKELDRDTIRNIPMLVDLAGLVIYK
jgi:hypothetical protein